MPLSDGLLWLGLLMAVSAFVLVVINAWSGPTGPTQVRLSASACGAVSFALFATGILMKVDW